MGDVFVLRFSPDGGRLLTVWSREVGRDFYVVARSKDVNSDGSDRRADRISRDTLKQQRAELGEAEEQELAFGEQQHEHRADARRGFAPTRSRSGRSNYAIAPDP